MVSRPGSRNFIWKRIFQNYFQYIIGVQLQGDTLISNNLLTRGWQGGGQGICSEVASFSRIPSRDLMKKATSNCCYVLENLLQGRKVVKFLMSVDKSRVVDPCSAPPSPAIFAPLVDLDPVAKIDPSHSRSPVLLPRGASSLPPGKEQDPGERQCCSAAPSLHTFTPH